jgi:hypothetical protein
MHSLLRPSWWVSMFLSTFMTIFFIYLIKKVTTKVQIPVVSTMVEEVA